MCGDCSGLWLESSVLGQLLKSATPRMESAVPANTSVQAENCPKCNQKMTLVNYAYDSGVFINRCADCEGIWLEKGQLEQIASVQSAKAPAERIANALVAEMHESRPVRIARSLIRSRWASGLLAGFYLVLQGANGADLSALVLMFIALLFPLACIWFAEALGNLTGVTWGLTSPSITQTTPADFVAIGGWIVLLTPAVIWLL